MKHDAAPLDLSGLLWPADQAGSALITLAQAAGFSSGPAGAAFLSAPAGASGRARFDGLACAAVRAGIDLDRAELPWAGLGSSLPLAAPALLWLPEAEGWLALLSRRCRLFAVTPGGGRHRLPAARLGCTLCRPAEQRAGGPIAALLAELPLAARRSRRAARALVAAHLAGEAGPEILLLGRAAERPLREQLLAGRLPRRACGLAAARCGMEAVSLAGWLLLGRSLFAGRPEPAWLGLWALLLLALPLLHAVELQAAAGLAERLGLILHRRLLASLLAIDPGANRGDGLGRLLGRLLAAEEVERVALGGMPLLLLAAAELAGAALVLSHGAAPHAHLAALAGAVLAVTLASQGCRRALDARADHRGELTAGLIETLAGHRTHLAAGADAGSTAAADESLARLHALACRRDRWEAALRVTLPRLWAIVALAALAPSLAAAGAVPGRLAASLGGFLLARDGLQDLGLGAGALAAAASAARQLGPLIRRSTAGGRLGGEPGGAGGRLDAEPAGGAGSRLGAEPAARDDGGCGPPVAGLEVAADRHTGPWLIEARGLACRPAGCSRPVLAGADLRLRPGDRVLLEGASGAGKSTLAAVLGGALAPDAGLLLLDGLDLASLGAHAWRRRAVVVPQLNANHLFAETLAFNLLLGRTWPPRRRDLQEAAALCRELGLGPLLARLPAGLEQRIGEAGWQLSDGEASRVCLARALLQDPELVILDESLAALDPGSRLQVLATLERRARTLVLIAHAERARPGATASPRRNACAASATGNPSPAGAGGGHGR
jgi:ATP-binding cassette, subfamily B, bacterial